MLAWSLDMASATHQGRVRLENEDCLAANGQLGYAVLADGMGGCNAGEVASRIAVDTLERGLRQLCRSVADLDEVRLDKALVREVSAANAAIYAAARTSPRYSGMGTTVVAALWRGDLAVVAHVGDSRAYRLRGEAFEQLTRDHSLAQEQVDSGVIGSTQARHAPGRSFVTRALGVDRFVAVEVHVHAARAGDVYLLCSDGLSDMLDDASIAGTLGGSQADLAAAAQALVEHANDKGGRDNVSVILARLDPVDRTTAQDTAEPQSRR